jgi:dihydroorotate dehydrogenase electron transfer subunit
LSVSLTAANALRTMRIRRVKAENETTKTFIFEDTLCAKAEPGQFLMLWIPGVDEIPLSIMAAGENLVSVSVKAVGEATRALNRMRRGEVVGVRGPFGNFFTESQGSVVLVGGGTGIVPLLFLARRLAAKASARLTFVVGAKTKSELLFLKEIKGLCAESSVAATEDGSYGLECLATQPLEKLLQEKRFDMVYACGPEPMMRRVFDLAEEYDVPLEASLERLMRCGIGLCGSCMIGKYRVCRDGPVFDQARLREVKDALGIVKLGWDGKRVPL